MNLTTKQRIRIIKKLAKKTIAMGEEEGIFSLEEYAKTNIENNALHESRIHPSGRTSYLVFSYKRTLKFIQSLNNEIVIKMYKDQFPEEAEKELLAKKPLYHLSTDKLVLFFSHSKNVKLLLQIKNILEKTDWIECFVAHKDIKASKEWKKEIRKYLDCCHGMVAFLSEDFKISNYCDQELGVAINRNIPIFPIKLDDTNPYGFIDHIQAVKFNNERTPEKLANQIEEFVLDKQNNLYHIAQSKLENIANTLISHFLNSTNTQMAESVLDQLMRLKSDQIKSHFIDEIKKNWNQNKKIMAVINIEEKMEKFFQNHQKDILKNESFKGDNKKQEGLKIPLQKSNTQDGRFITTE